MMAAFVIQVVLGVMCAGSPCQDLLSLCLFVSARILQ